MVDTIEALLRLQKVETKFAVLRRRRESKAHRIEEQKRLLRQAESKLSDSRRICQEHQIKLDALSLEVAAIEEAVSKHREALNRAKTNKEYAAILTALNTEKADNAKRESGILEHMEQIQTIKQDLERMEEERDKRLENIVTAEESLSALDQSTKGEIDSLTAARQKFAEGVPPATLDVFLRTAVHHDGEAVAPVIKVHPKRQEYACGGCNMTVSLELVNSLQCRSTIQLCKACERILYFETSEAAS